jgi:ABC-2 type transport system permease protein
MLISSLNSLIENEGVRMVLDWFSIYSRFSVFTHGVFDFGALFYYLLIAGVFVFITIRVFDAKREN